MVLDIDEISVTCHLQIADSEPECEDKEGNLFPSEGSCTVSLEVSVQLFFISCL